MINVVPTSPSVLAAFQRLYRDFVAPGDLVFDVGANIGENTALFSSLEARVVALEPLEECAAAIAAGPGVHVERCAAGASAGELEVLVCSHSLDVSSASPEWIGAMQRAGLVRGPWDCRIVVLMVTLDDLIARHGLPTFVKIDVEGYEFEVLKGLSQRVGAVSLESHRVLLDKSLACLERLGELGFERFAISSGHSAELSPWTDARGAAQALAQLEWGDLYAC